MQLLGQKTMSEKQVNGNVIVGRRMTGGKADLGGRLEALRPQVEIKEG
jgi:hypothetical protein